MSPAFGHRPPRPGHRSFSQGLCTRRPVVPGGALRPGGGAVCLFRESEDGGPRCPRAGEGLRRKRGKCRLLMSSCAALLCSVREPHQVAPSRPQPPTPPPSPPTPPSLTSPLSATPVQQQLGPCSCSRLWGASPGEGGSGSHGPWLRAATEGRPYSELLSSPASRSAGRLVTCQAFAPACVQASL